MKGSRIILTPKQEAYLIRHFKHEKNDILAVKLGISPRSIVRQARRLGLNKSKQFMTKCRNEMIAKANESNRVNGTYPPKGYHIPRSEEFQFKKGVTPLQRLGKKKEEARIRKCVEARRKTFASERWRAIAGFAYGLSQQTKMRVLCQPREKIALRSYLKKRGYQLDEINCVAYYNNQTKRCVRIEAREECFYKFAPVEVKNQKCV